jgi:hypothetical protein
MSVNMCSYYSQRNSVALAIEGSWIRPLLYRPKTVISDRQSGQTAGKTNQN